MDTIMTDDHDDHANKKDDNDTTPKEEEKEKEWSMKPNDMKPFEHVSAQSLQVLFQHVGLASLSDSDDSDAATPVKVLEVGAGLGTNSLQAFPIAKCPLSLLLTDVSPEMVHEAQQNVENKAPPGSSVTVTEANAVDLCPHFESNSIDFYIANLVLHHTSNVNKALSEAFRVLKVGGSIGIAEVNAANPGEVWSLIQQARETVYGKTTDNLHDHNHGHGHSHGHSHGHEHHQATTNADGKDDKHDHDNEHDHDHDHDHSHAHEHEHHHQDTTTGDGMSDDNHAHGHGHGHAHEQHQAPTTTTTNDEKDDNHVHAHDFEHHHQDSTTGDKVSDDNHDHGHGHDHDHEDHNHGHDNAKKQKQEHHHDQEDLQEQEHEHSESDLKRATQHGGKYEWIQLLQQAGFVHIVAWEFFSIVEARNASNFAKTFGHMHSHNNNKNDSDNPQNKEKFLQELEKVAQEQLNKHEPIRMGIIILLATKP